MGLDALQKVSIDRDGGYKFIVALVSKDGVSKLVIRANQTCDYHRDILAILRNEIYRAGMSARCIGGGRIKIDPSNKTIAIWDSSGDFGVEPDRNETVRMLQKAYPDFTVTASR